MKTLHDVAQYIDEILSQGIEIHQDSPVHLALKKALQIQPKVTQRQSFSYTPILAEVLLTNEELSGYQENVHWKFIMHAEAKVKNEVLDKVCKHITTDTSKTRNGTLVRGYIHLGVKDE